MALESAQMAEPMGNREGVFDYRDFKTIYTTYFGFVWRCLQGYGVPTAALDDAAQDVFVIVHRRLGDFRGDSTLRTWLYSIVRNVAANRRRSEKRRGSLAALKEDVPCSDSGPIEYVQQREAVDFVRCFLAKIDDKKRDVFILALLEGMTIPEVAETLNIPLNTAYTRLRSVRLEFRRALQNRRGQP